jgi:HK97 family phage major capsid protein
MSEVVKRLRERRANVWEQAKSLADKAADENRAFNGEEQSQWDTINAELDALDKRAKASSTASSAPRTPRRRTPSSRASRRSEGSDAADDARGPRSARCCGRGRRPRGIEVKPRAGSTSVPCRS